MKRFFAGVVIGLALGWLVGVATGFAAIAVTGGWYFYRLSDDNWQRDMANGCEPIAPRPNGQIFSPLPARAPSMSQDGWKLQLARWLILNIVISAAVSALVASQVARVELPKTAGANAGQAQTLSVLRAAGKLADALDADAAVGSTDRAHNAAIRTCEQTT